MRMTPELSMNLFPPMVYGQSDSQLNTIVTAMSGQPIGIITGGGFNGRPRPDVVPGVPRILSESPANGYINPLAFATPAGEDGNLGRLPRPLTSRRAIPVSAGRSASRATRRAIPVLAEKPLTCCCRAEFPCFIQMLCTVSRKLILPVLPLDSTVPTNHL